MKTKLSIIGFSALLFVTSNAAIVIAGNGYSGLGTLAPIGTLVLLTVDSTSDGTLGVPSLAGNLTSSSVSPLEISSASVTTGTFGGDLILGRADVTTAGSLPLNFTFDNVASIQGKRFSLVFLPSLGLTSNNTNVTGSTTYGIVSGTDWILPAVNGGESFTTSASDASGATSFFRVVLTAGNSANAQFATSSGAVLTVVPEPSAALLGAVGAICLLRRRRN